MSSSSTLENSSSNNNRMKYDINNGGQEMRNSCMGIKEVRMITFMACSVRIMFVACSLRIIFVACSQ